MRDERPEREANNRERVLVFARAGFRAATEETFVRLRFIIFLTAK